MNTCCRRIPKGCRNTSVGAFALCAFIILAHVNYVKLPLTQDIIEPGKDAVGDSITSTGTSLTALSFPYTRSRTHLSLKALLVIGVATVSRPRANYVSRTLQNLIQLANPFLVLNQIVILVLIADHDTQKGQKIQAKLMKKFAKEISTGVLKVTQRNNSLLPPPLQGITTESGCDESSAPSCSYIRWRNKQNLDYAQLLYLGGSIGDYYVQLEDDIECGNQMFAQLLKAIQEHSRRRWIIAEISNLGFIGKMFPSAQALLLSQYLLEHYNEKACDWLYPDFIKSQPSSCFSDELAATTVNDTCDESSKTLILYRQDEDICRHIGRISSLGGKSWS